MADDMNPSNSFLKNELKVVELVDSESGSSIKRQFVLAQLEEARETIEKIIEPIAVSLSDVIIKGSQDIPASQDSQGRLVTVTELTTTTTMSNISVTGDLSTRQLLIGSNPNRKALIIINNSSDFIYVGGASVTVNNGIPIQPNANFTMDAHTGELYVIAADSNTRDVRVAEIS